MLHAMLPTLVMLACCILAAGTLGTHALSVPEVLYKWTTLDYQWPNLTMRQEYLDSGKFIPENNAIAGLKVWQGQTFLTVPRWREGVPATLVRVVASPDPDEFGNTHVLQPWPSWEMNDPENPRALNYVQSMEIDLQGRMWVLDTSRLYFLSTTVPSPATKGTPRLTVWHVDTKTLLRTFVFPDAIASYTSTFLNDIVLDVPRGFAYITDTSAPGGIIVYDYNKNQARRFHGGPGMQNEVSTMRIDGEDYAFDTPVDGIALSADRTTLYYCPLAGVTISSIATELLRDFSKSNSELSAAVHTVGAKASYSDGLAVDEHGVMYFGLLNGATVQQWDTSKPFAGNQRNIIEPDHTQLQWPDTFAFDGAGHLLFTTNQLEKYFTGKMNFSDVDDHYNFRVVRVNIGANSYLHAQPPNEPDAESEPTISLAMAGLGAALLVLLCLPLGFLLSHLCARRKRNQLASDDQYHVQRSLDMD